MDDPRSLKVENLVRDFFEEAKKADRESSYNSAVPHFNGVINAFVGILYRALDDENHLVDYLPHALHNAMEQIKSEAVMNKLREDA